MPESEQMLLVRVFFELDFYVKMSDEDTFEIDEDFKATWRVQLESDKTLLDRIKQAYPEAADKSLLPSKLGYCECLFYNQDTCVGELENNLYKLEGFKCVYGLEELLGRNEFKHGEYLSVYLDHVTAGLIQFVETYQTEIADQENIAAECIRIYNTIIACALLLTVKLATVEHYPRFLLTMILNLIPVF